MTVPNDGLLSGGPPRVDGSLLAGLPEGTRRAVAAAATAVVLSAGEWLFRAGDPSDALYVVQSGRVEVVDEDREGPLVLRVLGPGAALGEIGLLSGEPRSASIRARRDTVLLRLDSDRFEGLVRQDPTVALALTRALGRMLVADDGRAAARQPSSVTRVVAVVTLGARTLSRDQVRQALDGAFGQGAGVLLTVDDGHGAVPDGSTADLRARYAGLLDAAERRHEVVLLDAGSGDAAGTVWTDFCLRSADRVVVGVPPGETPERCPRSPEHLRDVLPGAPDLCFVDPDDDALIGRWLDALPCRAHHLVRTTTPALLGQTLGRLLRRVTGRSVGIVLSGGGARGFAHIGVLSVIEDAGIAIDRVGGCSMGAIMGAMCAAGHDSAAMVELGRYYFVQGRPLTDYTVPRSALLRGERMAGLLRDAFGPGPIEALPRDFYCVSADLVAAEPVVHRRGPLWQALHTSVSIPGLLPPRAVGGRLLVDGGVLDNLPVGIMADMGEGPVLAVDVMRPFTPGPTGTASGPEAGAVRARRRPRLGRPVGPGLPPIGEVLGRATVLGSWRAARANRARAALVVTVPDDDTGLLDFDRIDVMVAAGRGAAQAALPELRAAVRSESRDDDGTVTG